MPALFALPTRLAYGARSVILNPLRCIAASVTLALGLSVATQAPAETVIAALGDSLTQGYGLPEAEGFVPQLEAWLRARGHDVRLINAGVSGDTTAGGLSRIGWTLTDEVDGLIVALGGNDMLRAIDPDVSRANLDGILAEARGRGLPVLLAGMIAPGNYGPDYKARFEGMYPALADQHGALVYPNFLAGLYNYGDTAEAVRLMQADGLHPSARGVALIVEDIGPHVERLLAEIVAGSSG